MIILLVQSSAINANPNFCHYVPSVEVQIQQRPLNRRPLKAIMAARAEAEQGRFYLQLLQMIYFAHKYIG
jgi:hypothetical protein